MPQRFREWVGDLEVLLSAEINTDEEKATFIAHAYDALQDILGDLASIFYIAVREIPALDWGYNGIPQGAGTLTPINRGKRRGEGWPG